jgi:hypothetical protein
VERLTRLWLARSAGGASPVTGRQADAIGKYAVEGVKEAILNRASVVTSPLPRWSPGPDLPSEPFAWTIEGCMRRSTRPGSNPRCRSTGMGSILRPSRGPESALAVIRDNRLDVSTVGFGFVAVPF